MNDIYGLNISELKAAIVKKRIHEKRAIKEDCPCIYRGGYDQPIACKMVNETIAIMKHMMMYGNTNFIHLT